MEERRGASLNQDVEWLLSLDELDTPSGYVTDAPDVHVKPAPNSEHLLVMRTSLIGFHDHPTFAVRIGSGQEELLSGAEWADWDQSGRLVFAREGKLFALSHGGASAAVLQQLIDLNGNKPERIPPPDWAKVW